MMHASALGLVVLGLMNLFTLAETAEIERLLLVKQMAFLAVGIGIIVLLASLDYRVLRLKSEIVLAFWAVTTGLMLIALIAGVSIRGAASWLVVGPVSFGPAELAKLALIVVLAKYFASRAEEIAAPRHLIGSSVFAALPAGIALLQPDFGSAALFFAIWFGVVFVLGLPLKRFIALAAILLLAGILLWNFVLRSYQQERILSFVYPERDPLGSAWQAQQALVAVGSGGWLGRGFSETLQARLGMLPESATDFAFAALVEQFGFAGAVVLILLFGILMWRVLRVVWQATNNFSRACAAGIVVLFAAHVAIHVGMNIGLFPVTGIPLPFVSYGGSHLLTAFAMLGLVESIRLHQPQMLQSQSFGAQDWERSQL